jgi:hypothetical protein
MKKMSLVVVSLFLILSSNAFAAQTFFGENQGLGEGTPLSSWTNATTAQTNFLSNLVGVGTESFETYSGGTGTPLPISFPGAGTATMLGTGSVAEVTPGNTNGVGRYATDGSHYWESGGVFSIQFSAPVAAFGFFGIDIGDFDGQLTATMIDGTTVKYTIPNTIGGNGGSVLFWGIIDTAHPFTQVDFGNTAAGTDFFGFDQFTIGSVEQVHPTPEPGMLLLLGAGFLGLIGLRRKVQK